MDVPGQETLQMESQIDCKRIACSAKIFGCVNVAPSLGETSDQGEALAPRASPPEIRGNCRRGAVRGTIQSQKNPTDKKKIQSIQKAIKRIIRPRRKSLRTGMNKLCRTFK